MRREPTDTTGNGNPRLALPDPGDTDIRHLVDQLVAAGADADPEGQRTSRAIRVELEDHVLRSRRDSSSLTVERWSRRLTSALRRADRTENRLARLQQRRWFRLSRVSARMLRRPLRLPTLLPDLIDAFRRRPLPRLPERPDVQLRLPQVPPTSRRRAPYAHLRIAHGGRLRIFDGLARHVDIHDTHEMAPEAFDLLVLEPGFDERLADVPAEALDRFVEAQVPSILFVRTAAHLRLPQASRVSVVVTDEPELAREAPAPVLVLDPSVDPRLHNPVGWERDPSGDILDLDDTPELWGEDLIREIKAHRVATASRREMALIAAAAGTPVVAPADATLDRLLGDLYLSGESPQQLKQAAESMRDNQIRERLSVAARRHVLNHHTRLARLEQILEHLSVPRVAPPSVSVLLATRRPERLEEAIANVSRQDWPTLDLVLMLHDPDLFDREAVEKMTSRLDIRVQIVECPPTWTLGDCLNAGLERAGGEYIAKMDDDDHYGELHLRDLVTCLLYAEAAAVGKLSNVTFLSGRDLTVDWRIDDQERFVHHLAGATMMMRRELALRYRFDRVEHGVDTALWQRMRAEGMALYSTHRLNFIRVRHGDHTYGRSDEDFLRLAKDPPEPGLEPEKWFG